MIPSRTPLTAFVGGGNMAVAILGGLRRSGAPAEAFVVVEPNAAQRDKLRAELGIEAQAQADARLAGAALVVWAVKPQVFAEAAAPCAPHVGHALQLSIMAGIRSEAVVAATGSARVVRAMPNTPALVGRGIAGLYARPAATAQDRAAVEAVLEPTGSTLWVEREADLDVVTALSGSGPAYVFYFIEALEAAGLELGLAPETARALALQTFAGAAQLAVGSTEPPSVLRERVTSKGGTTERALASMQSDKVGELIRRAVRAANDRAREMGEQLGRDA